MHRAVLAVHVPHWMRRCMPTSPWPDCRAWNSTCALSTLCVPMRLTLVTSRAPLGWAALHMDNFHTAFDAYSCAHWAVCSDLARPAVTSDTRCPWDAGGAKAVFGRRLGVLQSAAVSAGARLSVRIYIFDVQQQRQPASRWHGTVSPVHKCAPARDSATFGEVVSCDTGCPAVLPAFCHFPTHRPKTLSEGWRGVTSEKCP
jgi:hypothetical protein